MVKSVHAEEAKAFAARLRLALDGAGVRSSPAIVAHEFNLRYWGKSITAHTARAWLVGVSIPMQDKLRTLSEWLRVSPDELRFGLRGPSHDDLVRDGDPLTDGLNFQDREMLARYMELPPAYRKTVQEVVQAMAVAARGSAQAGRELGEAGTPSPRL